MDASLETPSRRSNRVLEATDQEKVQVHTASRSIYEQMSHFPRRGGSRRNHEECDWPNPTDNGGTEEAGRLFGGRAGELPTRLPVPERICSSSQHRLQTLVLHVADPGCCVITTSVDCAFWCRPYCFDLSTC
ncbi:hypothetical protein RvY_10607 [Ramazzottius varieornatus]|uniref:Uncharacterized protein n=1 Tax=Ramazzottius varieornatus TaxID=947166 RepID=A0A1D1VDD3_RAMVA|nr:hypothetical protein RvY_10607 [Ramazzottius varieornatus]